MLLNSFEPVFSTNAIDYFCLLRQSMKVTGVCIRKEVHESNRSLKTNLVIQTKKMVFSFMDFTIHVLFQCLALTCSQYFPVRISLIRECIYAFKNIAIQTKFLCFMTYIHILRKILKICKISSLFSFMFSALFSFSSALRNSRMLKNM